MEHIAQSTIPLELEFNNVKQNDFPKTFLTRNRISTLSPVEIIKSRVLHGMPCGIESDLEDSFFVSDLGDVVRQFKLFKRLLPRIEPFFAMKCCPDPMVLQVLNRLGTGFDCASRGEIETVIGMGVDPSRIIYANPCKQPSHLRYAASQHVIMMTFDNEDELRKIKKNHPHAQLVMRIQTDDSKAACRLSLKFGAPLDRVTPLLQVAKELELNVIGISFHVGSGCYDVSAFGDAVVRARKAFDYAAQVGYKFNFLDVGGGFPGGHKKSGITFPQIAQVLGPMVDELFDNTVRVIAEPGRYFISKAFTLSVQVTSRRTIRPDVESSDDKNKYMYYVNDGLYGSFNCLTFDHAEVNAKVLLRQGKFVYDGALLLNDMSRDDKMMGSSDSGVSSGESDYSSDDDMNSSGGNNESVSVMSQQGGDHDTGSEQFLSSIWGPTCDSIDCIGRDVLLPEMNVGDWLVYEDMGAYTMCAASNFNGFRKSTVIYTNTEDA